MSYKDKLKFWKGSNKTIKKKYKSWWYYPLIVAFIIFLLNFAMILPQQWSALLFELEMGVLQFLKARLIMHRWEFGIIFLFLTIFGPGFYPTLRASSLDDNGKTFFYYRKKVRGRTAYFKRIGKKTIAVNVDNLSRKFPFRYETKDYVERSHINGVIALETDNLEVTKSEIDKNKLKVQAERISNLQEAIKNGGITLTKDNAIEMLNRVKRGAIDEQET